MTISVIGCGESAREWYKTPCDLSIGVNDMFKFGAQPNQLVLINFQRKFDKQRLDTILKTRPEKVWTHTSTWQKHFSNAVIMKLTTFNGYLRDGLIYSSKTSPMVAVSLAVRQQATEIILWGCDFKDHSTYRTGTKDGDYEVKTYLKFFQEIQKRGIKIWLGANGSAFDLYLPLYDKAIVIV